MPPAVDTKRFTVPGLGGVAAIEDGLYQVGTPC